MKTYKYGPDHKLFDQITQRDSLFFLISGTVSLYQIQENQKGNKIKDARKENDMLNEYGFLSDRPPKVCGITQNVVHVVVLEKEDFLQELHTHDQDYEIYCKIKDQLQFQDYSRGCGIKCLICDNYYHYQDKCPYTYYQANKSKLSYNFYKKIGLEQQERQKFTRTGIKINNTLEWSSVVRISVIQFIIDQDQEENGVDTLYKIDQILKANEINMGGNKSEFLDLGKVLSTIKQSETEYSSEISSIDPNQKDPLFKFIKQIQTFQDNEELNSDQIIFKRKQNTQIPGSDSPYNDNMRPNSQLRKNNSNFIKKMKKKVEKAIQLDQKNQKGEFHREASSSKSSPFKEFKNFSYYTVEQEEDYPMQEQETLYINQPQLLKQDTLISQTQENPYDEHNLSPKSFTIDQFITLDNFDRYKQWDIYFPYNNLENILNALRKIYYENKHKKQHFEKKKLSQLVQNKVLKESRMKLLNYTEI